MQTPVHCRSIDDNIRLRCTLRARLRQASDRPVLVATNIKAFSRHAERYYRETIATAGMAGARLILSIERPSEYGHDLVGWLHLLERMDLSQDGPMLFVLDGGKKSRNYLLTLHFAYQGLYRLGDGALAWSESVLTAAAVAAQLPGGWERWCVLCASDYDIVPSDMTVGASVPQALASLAGQADCVLFSHAPHAALAELARHREAMLGIPGLQHMQAHEAARAIVDALGAEAVGTLVAELVRLTQKGIILADDAGRLRSFREKPSLAELLALSAQGQLLENVMYLALSREAVADLARCFASPAACGGAALRDTHVFGVFATLFAAPHTPLDEYRAAWLRACPAASDRTAWLADGEAIHAQASAWLARRSVLVASFGANAAVHDMGEPQYYLEALRERHFSAPGRAAAGIAVGETTSTASIMAATAVPAIELVRTSVDARARLALDGGGCVRIVDCAIRGPGELRVAVPAQACVLLMNCQFDLAGGDVRISASAGAPANGGATERVFLHVMDSCDVAHGAHVVGDRSLVVGWRGEGELRCGSDEIVAGFALFADEAAPEGESVWGAYRASLAVPANVAGPSGLSPLDTPCLLGKTFHQALVLCDLPGAVARR